MSNSFKKYLSLCVIVFSFVFIGGLNVAFAADNNVASQLSSMLSTLQGLLVKFKTIQLASVSAAGSITVTAPTTGDIYKWGDSITIKWDSVSTRSYGYVYIKMYDINGTIMSGSWVPNTGSYTFVVGPTMNNMAVKGQFKFGVFTWNNVGSTAPSEATGQYFTVTDNSAPAPVITVLSPNGGETFEPGKTYAIRWSATGLPGGVNLMLTTEDGRDQQSLGSFSNTGSESWLVPLNIPNGKYKIKIQSQNLDKTVDSSDAAFTIINAPVAPIITLLAAKELNPTTKSTGISWSVIGATECYLSGGRFGFSTSVDKVLGTADTGPLNSSTTFGLSCINGSAVTKKEIVVNVAEARATPTVLYPNGGETFKIGDTIRVVWNTGGSNSTNAAIGLYDASGNENLGNGSSITTSRATGAIDFTIPSNILPGKYKIKVYDIYTFDTVASYPSDLSDGYFTVTDGVTPVITNVVGKAAGNLEIDAGGTLAITGINLGGKGGADVFIGGMFATVTQESDTLLWVTAPASLTVGGSTYVQVKNYRGTSNIVTVKVIGTVASSKDYIKVLSPAQGDTLYFGDTKQIRWSYNGTNLPTNKNIDISIYNPVNLSKYPLVWSLNEAGSGWEKDVKVHDWAPSLLADYAKNNANGFVMRICVANTELCGDSGTFKIGEKGTVTACKNAGEAWSTSWSPAGTKCCEGLSRVDVDINRQTVKCVAATVGSYTVTQDNSNVYALKPVRMGAEAVLSAFRFTNTSNEPVSIKQIVLRAGPEVGSYNLLSGPQATIWDGATQVGMANFSASNNVAVTLFSPVVIPPATTHTIIIKGIPVTSDGKQAGARLTINYDGSNNGLNGNYATGVNTGMTISPSSATTNTAGIIIYRNVPTIEVVSNGGIFANNVDTYKVKVTNPGATDMALSQLTFAVVTTGSLTSGCTLYADDIPVASAIDPIKNILKIVFDSSSSTKIIPAGSSKVYTLRCTLPDVANMSESVSIALKADGTAVSGGSTASSQRAVSNTVWSPMTNTTLRANDPAFENVADWVNGFALPAFPIIGQDFPAQTWTRLDGEFHGGALVYAYDPVHGVSSCKEFSGTIPAGWVEDFSKCDSYLHPVVKTITGLLGAPGYSVTMYGDLQLTGDDGKIYEVNGDNIPNFVNYASKRVIIAGTVQYKDLEGGFWTITVQSIKLADTESCVQQGGFTSSATPSSQCCSGLIEARTSAAKLRNGFECIKWPSAACVAPGVSSSSSAPAPAPASSRAVAPAPMSASSVAPAPVSVNVACTALTYELREGAQDNGTNGEVTKLQRFLKSSGYTNVEPTGYFGALTVKAVQIFQGANGIPSQTGGVGKLTRDKIRAVSCK